MDAEIKKDPDQYGQLLSEIPLGRMGKPEEVAGLAVYLASDRAAYITFVIDGGMMRQSGSL
jgi:glucose 1-dehydrogenase